VVSNYREIAAQFKLQLDTCCDSEVLGKLIVHYPGSLADRAKWAAEQTSGPLAIMGLWANPTRLLIVKSGNPLFFARVKRGYYLSSVIDGIPGSVKTVPDDFVDVLKYPPLYPKPTTEAAVATGQQG
jgi:glucosamine 6-phosphate synthetase-like amidotransferase/phosphosugar isomerase protein